MVSSRRTTSFWLSVRYLNTALIIDNADFTIVFAPWCGHCKALAPEYEEAATELKDKDIALAKIDCTEQQELCQSYGVEGYPTLKLFRGVDNVQPYQGPRKAAAIVSYMTKQSLPPVSLLESGDSLEEFKTADKVVLVGYFSADEQRYFQRCR
jgi:protein disulfide-isomerase A1